MKRRFIVLPLVEIPLLLCFFSTQLVAKEEPQKRGMLNRINYNVTKESFPANSLCGVWSVYIILRNFGINNTYEEVLTNMPPGIYGNSMQQIVNFLGNNSNIEVRPIRCNATELYRELSKISDRKAIINLSDHWVVVQDITDNAFEIIDFPQKYFMPVDVIDELWDGYAIIVHRRSLVFNSLMSGVMIFFFSIMGILMIMLARKFHRNFIPEF